MMKMGYFSLCVTSRCAGRMFSAEFGSHLASERFVWITGTVRGLVLAVVQQVTKQPKLTAIIQSCRLILSGHIMRMDGNADAKRTLLASPPADWRRQPGRPCITWLSTVQQDLKQQHLTLPEAADLAQNHPLWRMMSTYGATQS